MILWIICLLCCKKSRTWRGQYRAGDLYFSILQLAIRTKDIGTKLKGCWCFFFLLSFVRCEIDWNKWCWGVCKRNRCVWYLSIFVYNLNYQYQLRARVNKTIFKLCLLRWLRTIERIWICSICMNVCWKCAFSPLIMRLEIHLFNQDNSILHAKLNSSNRGSELEVCNNREKKKYANLFQNKITKRKSHLS